MTRYAFVLYTAARQQWAYRTEMGLRAVSMVLFMGIFVALWNTAYGISKSPQLAGYSHAAILWYLAMTETVTLSSSRIHTRIAEEVRGGSLAYTLTRPLSYPFFQVAQSLGTSLPSLGINLLTASAVVLIGSGGEWAGSPAGLLTFLILAGLALILDALIAVLIGLLAFWLEEVTPIYWIYQKLLFTVGGLFLPLEFFPTWLQKITQWMPFQFISYAPARAFVAFEPATVLQAATGQIIYIALFSLLILGVWGLAQRRMTIQGG